MPDSRTGSVTNELELTLTFMEKGRLPGGPSKFNSVSFNPIGHAVIQPCAGTILALRCEDLVPVLEKLHVW